MPTLREAIATFRARAAAGEIVNRKTGVRGPFATSRIAPIVSNVTAAVRHATRALDSGRELGDAALLEVELEPLWLALPPHVEQDARENERADPKKEAANVRLFVSAVTGRDIERAPHPIVVERVPGPFRPLYDAVVSAGARGALSDATTRSYKRGVLKAAELLLTQGRGTPEQMPDDPAEVHAWGTALGWSRKDVAYCLTAYRAARELAGATHLPTCYELVDEDGLGIRSLPDYRARLKAAGFEGDARTIRPLEATKWLAPDLGQALHDVIVAGRKRGMSKAWAAAREDAGSWVVATLLRHAPPSQAAGAGGQAVSSLTIDADVHRVTWLDLWLERREVQVAVNVSQAAQHSRYLQNRQSTSPTQTEHRSLMRLALDVSAARSYANSPLRLAKPEYERDPIPCYTEKLQQHLETAWHVTYEYFGTVLQAEAPEVWARARNEYEALQKHVADHNRPRAMLGRKPKDKLPASWPQMICMGLPWLVHRCYEIRGEMTDRMVRVGHLDSRDSQQLVNRYCEALRDWAAVLLLLDDGLRIKQYSGAMAGEQVIVTPQRDRHGQWIGVETVSTRWSGLDHENVRLKVWRRGDETNARTRVVTPAFLDRTLFFDFWTLARPRWLVSAGLLPSVEAYDPTVDTWALFPTARARSGQVAGYFAERATYEEQLVNLATGDERARPVLPTWRGNISEDSLSGVFGRAMHRICVEVLGRDLPAFDSPDLTRDWLGVFGGHITRTAIASYFGGIRGDWARAEWLTNDKEITLRRHYARLQATFDEVASRQDWECPTWFDSVIDRALQRHPGDDWGAFWRTFDPMKPEEALRRMIQGVPSTPRPRRPRAKV